MKNKIISRIAAIGIASITAVTAMAISASAVTTTLEQVSTSGSIPTVKGNVYKYLDNSGAIGVWKYYADSDRSSSAGYTKVSLTSVFSAGTTIWVNGTTGQVTDTDPGAPGWTKCKVADTGSNSNSNSSSSSSGASVGSELPSAVNRTSIHYASTSNLVYRGRLNGTTYYFPNYDSLRSSGASYIDSYTPSSSTSYATASAMDTRVYFNMLTGEYTNYSTPHSVSISGKTSSYDTVSSSSSSSIAVYRVNGKYYYPTYALALEAAGGDKSKLEYVRGYNAAPHRYFSMTTGTFFSSYNSAIADTGSKQENVIDLGPYYDSVYDYYGYYGSITYDPNDPYYNYYYGYYPYYGYYGYYGYYNSYWFDRYYNNSTGTSTSNTTSKDTSTATAGNVKGWTSINKNLAKVSAGTTVTINMNKENIIPADTLSAIKGKNVTLNFVLSNGAVFSINGKEVSSAVAFTPSVTYNTKLVPTKLIKSASKKNKAVSTAQISVTNGNFGFDADITVKLSSKRAGKTAKLYRYNASKNSLTLVDSSKIQSTGKCTFNDVNQGGNFLIVIC